MHSGCKHTYLFLQIVFNLCPLIVSHASAGQIRFCLVYLSAVCYNYLINRWACKLPTHGNDINSNKIFLVYVHLRDTSAWSLKKTKKGRVRNKLSCHQNVSSTINLWQLLVHCASDLIMKKSLVCLAGMLLHIRTPYYRNTNSENHAQQLILLVVILNYGICNIPSRLQQTF